jgi:hypothetical protein
MAASGIRAAGITAKIESNNFLFKGTLLKKLPVALLPLAELCPIKQPS